MNNDLQSMIIDLVSECTEKDEIIRKQGERINQYQDELLQLLSNLTIQQLACCLVDDDPFIREIAQKVYNSKFVCVKCNKRPFKVKKSKLCNSCYTMSNVKKNKLIKERLKAAKEQKNDNTI